MNESADRPRRIVYGHNPGVRIPKIPNEMRNALVKQIDERIFGQDSVDILDAVKMLEPDINPQHWSFVKGYINGRLATDKYQNTSLEALQAREQNSSNKR